MLSFLPVSAFPYFLSFLFCHYTITTRISIAAIYLRISFLSPEMAGTKAAYVLLIRQLRVKGIPQAVCQHVKAEHQKSHDKQRKYDHVRMGGKVLVSAGNQ